MPAESFMRTSAPGKMNLARLCLGAGHRRQVNPILWQSHVGQGAQYIFRVTAGSRAGDRTGWAASGLRRHRDHVEGGVGPAFERAANGRIECLLVSHVGSIEANDHERPTTGGSRARQRCRAGAGGRLAAHGSAGEAGAVELTVLDGKRQRCQIAALAREVAALARDVVAQFVKQPIDQHDGAVDLVFQNRELTMIFIDRSGQPIGRASRLQHESGHGAVGGA